MHTKCTRGNAVEILWKFLIGPATLISGIEVSPSRQYLHFAPTSSQTARAKGPSNCSPPNACPRTGRACKFQVGTACLWTATTQRGDAIRRIRRLCVPAGTSPNSLIASQRPLSREKNRTTTFHPRLSNQVFRTYLVPKRCDPRSIDGRDSASHYQGASGLGGAKAKADANEIEAGHCRGDHCGRSSGARPGHNPPFSSSPRRGFRQRGPGTNEFGSSGPTVKRWV